MHTIDYSEKNGIGTLTICREKALNSLNTDVLSELDALLERLEAQAPRCLLVRGAGTRAFVSGADIAVMAKLSREQAQAFSAFGNCVMLRLERFPAPTIAVICGYALGGGCELALACDLRICSDTAIFGQPETGLGIIPGFGGTQRLSRIVGAGRARELIFSASSIDAQEAYRIGLVNKVYEKEALFEASAELARKIANNAPIAVRKAKEAMIRGSYLDMEDGTSLEAQLFSETFETHDQAEGFAAFLERRKHLPYQGN